MYTLRFLKRCSHVHQFSIVFQVVDEKMLIVRFLHLIKHFALVAL